MNIQKAADREICRADITKAAPAVTGRRRIRGQVSRFPISQSRIIFLCNNEAKGANVMPFVLEIAEGLGQALARADHAQG